MELTQPKPQRALVPVLLRGAAVGLVVALVLHFGNILVGTNLHTVLPGAVYRCSQPSASNLEAVVRRYGIRTVVNMRGVSDPTPWYLEECRATQRLNVSLEDLSFSAGRLPSVPAIRQLLEVLDRSERPLLIHCHQGADRTGLASALCLLLYTDAGLPEARQQLGLRTGHLPIGRTANMGRFFDLYEEWLAAQGKEHSPHRLRHWVRHDYCAAECRARIEFLDPQARPLRVPCGAQVSLRVRCHNTSIKPWHFQPGTNAGIHVRYVVADEEQQPVREEARAGLFFRTIAPGEHVDLTLVLPPLKTPGRYYLRIDLADEQHGSFLQLGSEPLLWDLEAS